LPGALQTDDRGDGFQHLPHGLGARRLQIGAGHGAKVRADRGPALDARAGNDDRLILVAGGLTGGCTRLGVGRRKCGKAHGDGKETTMLAQPDDGSFHGSLSQSIFDLV